MPELHLPPALARSTNKIAHYRRDGVKDERQFHRFITRPDINAPIFDVNIRDDKALAPGYWFVAFYDRIDQSEPGNSWVGPHIYDDNGDLIWAGGRAFEHWNIFDFGVTDVGNDQKLTLLSTHDASAYILDNHYELEKEVALVINGERKPNMHSFHVVENGQRALILNLRPWMTTAEVSQRVGFDDSCDAEYQGFREVDLTSAGSEPLFQWDAKDWIGLEESTFKKYDTSVKEMCEKGWDILHFNSIDKFPDGDYLLSARHTDALYKISHRNGSILWRLGGIKNKYDFVGNARFSRQHHARVLSQDQTQIVISLFDNAIGDGNLATATNEYSRGMILILDTMRMTAEMTAEYPHPNKQRTHSKGSMQLLSNGNAFLCWAYSTLLSEHTANGTLVMQASLKVPIHSYRGFKHGWVGHPSRPPDVLSKASWNKDRYLTGIYVSWNGATEVDSWSFYLIEKDGRAQLMGSAKRDGFETSIIYHGYAPDVFVEAFDESGNSLGQSPVVHTVRSGRKVLEPHPVDNKDSNPLSAQAGFEVSEELNHVNGA